MIKLIFQIFHFHICCRNAQRWGLQHFYNCLNNVESAAVLQSMSECISLVYDLIIKQSLRSNTAFILSAAVKLPPFIYFYAAYVTFIIIEIRPTIRSDIKKSAIFKFLYH